MNKFETGLLDHVKKLREGTLGAGSSKQADKLNQEIKLNHKIDEPTKTEAATLFQTICEILGHGRSLKIGKREMGRFVEKF